MKYKKRGTAKNLEEYVIEKTGKTPDTLSNPNDFFWVKKIHDAAKVLWDAAKEKRPVYVYGDYDCDGITSVIGLWMLLFKIGAKFMLCIPDRDDGYGVTETYVNKLPDHSILLTVDNGISALPAMQAAAKKGIDVVILDHHLSTTGTLPDVKVLIDPEALPGTAAFNDYCGAGLVYKLCEAMFPDDLNFLSIIAAFSSIGTVGDVVSVLGDNRNIIKLGLQAINNGNVPQGINEVISLLNLSGHVHASDLAFKLCPCTNAYGRMEKKGGQYVAAAYLSNGDAAKKKASDIIEKNEQRKEEVKMMVDDIMPDLKANLNFVALPNLRASLCGLGAAKLTEETGKPSFVMTDVGDLYKGSARSDDGSQNNVKQMLDVVAPLLASYGGHAGAAGFSFEKKNFEAVQNEMAKIPVKKHVEGHFFDLDLKPVDAEEVLIEMEHLEPFGKDFERPVFRIHAKFQEGDNYFHRIGQDHSHLAFDLPGGLKAVYFGAAEQYITDGCPKDVYLYGSLEPNYWNGQVSPNFMVEAMEKHS